MKIKASTHILPLLRADRRQAKTKLLHWEKLLMDCEKRIKQWAVEIAILDLKINLEEAKEKLK